MVSDWGNGFLRKGQVDDAIAMFQLNANNFPKSADVEVELGDALARKGDKAGATLAYQKALALSPGNQDIAAKLAGVKK